MNEELLNEQQFLRVNHFRQSELIANHCSGIKEKIRLSASISEAERIAASTCKNFEHECSSSIVRNALALHLQNIIEQYWKQK
jgi:hypothetical protein